MQQISDEVIFIVLILGIAIFIVVALLATVVLIRYYEQQRNDKFTSNPLFEPEHNVELESVEVAKTERVPKGREALDWWGCCIMLFVWVAMGIAGIWLLRPFLVLFLCYFVIFNCT